MLVSGSVHFPCEAASFLEIFDATVKALTDAGSNFSVEKKFGDSLQKGLPPLETNIAPENGWLEFVGILVSFWDGLFSGAMLVSGRVAGAE